MLNYPCKIAGSIKESNINEEIVSQRDQRKIDRFIILGLIAAHEAIKTLVLYLTMRQL